jgi:CubicO group peptidase (beta-lactamase class C family)
MMARPSSSPPEAGTMPRTALFLYASLALAACTSAPLSMAENGMLQDRLGRIDAAIFAEVSGKRIPGAVALIARDGEIVYHKAFGNADVHTRTPMTTDTIFRIASMTKAITTTAAMILYEQGHFQLNDPLADYLPAFADMQVVSEFNDDGTVGKTVPAGKQIRIIDLMTHTSGIAYPFIPGPLQKTYADAGIIDGLTTAELALAEQMALLAEQPLLFEPGTRFNYGLNSDLLGYLIEVVSGQPLDRFFAEHITEPLGMRDTAFYLPDSKAHRLATLYAHAEGRGLVAPHEVNADIELGDVNYPVNGAKTYFSGGAGLSSTAQDYARFLQMLLNDGELDGVRILGRKSVELMRTPRIDRDGDGKAETSLGFSVTNDLGKRGELGSVGAYAWGGAFYTTFWIDPAENLLAVFMSQGRPLDSDIDRRFSTLVYQALE